MNPYTDILDLREVVLEESFVLAVTASPGRLEFKIEAFVTERHSAYHDLDRSADGPYLSSTLIFAGVRSLVWNDQGVRPARDANGELDYGHIDEMTWDADRFELWGDWGHICLIGDPPTLAMG